MPIFEEFCPLCSATEDCYLPRWDAADPPCPRCLGPRRRLMSCFASPFSGSIHKYVDLNREGSHMDGWWAYRKRSSISGQPEPVYLDSMQAVKEFNRAEGLTAPGEVPTNSTISADGKSITSAGMPGNWSGPCSIPSRLREMISTPAEKCSAPPGTACPSMPSDYGVRVEAVEATAEVGG